MKRKRLKNRKNNSELPSIKRPTTSFNAFMSNSIDRKRSTETTIESNNRTSTKLAKKNSKLTAGSRKISSNSEILVQPNSKHKRAISQIPQSQTNLDSSKGTKFIRKTSSKPVFDHEQQKKQDVTKKGLSFMKIVSKLKGKQLAKNGSKSPAGQPADSDNKNQIQRVKFKEIFAKVDKKKILGECSYCFRKKCFRLVNSCKHASCYTCSQFLLDFNKYTGYNEMRCFYCPESTINEEMTESRKVTLEYLHYCFDNHGPDYTAEAPATQNKLEEEKDVNYNVINPEAEYCDHHLDKKNHYCVDCNKHLCYKCLKSKNPHLDHKVYYIDDLNIRAEHCNFKSIYDPQMDDVAVKLKETVTSLKHQKDLYLKKIETDFQLLQKIIEIKRDKINLEVSRCYDLSIEQAYGRAEALKLLKQRSKLMQELSQQAKEELAIIKRYKTNNLFQVMRNVVKKADIINIDQIDITESLILLDQNVLSEVHRIVEDIKFAPISQSYLDKVRDLFRKSTILKPNLITPEFVSMFEKLRSTERLFQLTRDGQSPFEFHEKCDNKGQTIMIIKTLNGHIFGGYNPTSWISEYVYSQCEDAFLFSLTDGKGRKCIKCPIERHKADKAIKQNQNKYSPGFGEANNSDLFIAFRKLDNSYSRLGNVYRCPNQYDPSTFLAGSETGWDIEEIEVWSIA
ncbi:unnamed protein product [Moneuplotes crassus]|uniref:B-box zinc finger family protein n=1 Tax=Euplotes crassus TaxID=5936 RepID=A0AAD1Y6X2_EUPCR|nr:unnamed protein product [Moneuplotes crassus]